YAPPPANSRAITRPTTLTVSDPPPIRSPSRKPTPAVNSSANSTTRMVLRWFDAICSYNGSELDLDGTARRIVDLEELPRREMPQPGHQVRGESPHHGVQGRHLVVVELPGVGDLRFGARQLL